ncbi:MULTISPECIES: cation:proton antiporter domain-containing protein [Streptomyces]|uniref:Kef-type K+ transport system, membrane component KefB n=1 Tax=Streptomyces misionensis TaxID=67331 RepID=A0A1H5DKZ9_9ACTN|nr:MULTISPECIES: cation:proton antiporter [Streptomyces]SED79514.1 Kef-type K+ transport system, membrane component KefB [Streptomyces misionensis]SFY48805.1 Na(+)/H(+)-K(+) antiporter GerN [Streptomyces sp. F-1]
MSAAEPLSAVLVAVPAVILACRAGGALLQRLGQPAVVGEMCVGIMLGPTLLGRLWPAAEHWLLPPSVLPFTDVLGQLGLLVFMFLIGLELDLGVLRGHRGTAMAIGQASIALPLLLGAGLGLAMYGTQAPEHVARLPFVLFIAVSMSITAFPVLARILAERGLYGTRVGTLAMACAAIGDVTAWCLLALVVSLAAGTSTMDAVNTVALTAGFAAVLVFGLRPLLARWVRDERRSTGLRHEAVVIAVLFSAVCLAGLATDRIGVHTIFGAFLLGTVMPRGTPAVERAAGQLRSVAVPLLLPLFFVQTGLRTDLGGLHDATEWLWAAAILLLAIAGKWGGATLAARAVGQDTRSAAAIGALMNCRGLTELIVLNIGYDMHVISAEVFTMLVLMALLTTALTGPVLTRLHPTTTPAPTRPEPSEPRDSALT